jgi:hypothetical protein
VDKCPAGLDRIGGVEVVKESHIRQVKKARTGIGNIVSRTWSKIDRKLKRVGAALASEGM